MRKILLALIIAVVCQGCHEEKSEWESKTIVKTVINDGIESRTTSNIPVKEYVFKRFAVGQRVTGSGVLTKATAEAVSFSEWKDRDRGAYSTNLTYELTNGRCMIPRNSFIEFDVEVYYDGEMNTVLVRPATTLTNK